MLGRLTSANFRCVFVSRPMKIVIFLRKNGGLPKLVVDFLLKNTFRKNMEIVEDFSCEDKNPLKSFEISLFSSVFFIFLHFSSLLFIFFLFHHFSSFFIIFFMFHDFSSLFIFLNFPYFSSLHFSLFFIFFTFLHFSSFCSLQVFIFSFSLFCIVSFCFTFFIFCHFFIFAFSFFVIDPCTFLISHVNTALIMLWIRKLLESPAINKQVIVPIHFVTWYTQPGVLNAGKLLCCEVDRTGERDRWWRVNLTAKGQHQARWRSMRVCSADHQDSLEMVGLVYPGESVL